MVRAQIKGAEGVTPKMIFNGEVWGGEKIDITPYLTSQFERLYIHGYKSVYGGDNIPSTSSFSRSS